MKTEEAYELAETIMKCVVYDSAIVSFNQQKLLKMTKILKNIGNFTEISIFTKDLLILCVYIR